MPNLKAAKVTIPLVAAFACVAGPALATPILGSDLASFTVLGASTVTNIPTSTIVGNVGVYSSGGVNAIVGFNSSPGGASDPQVTGGSVYAGGSLAQSAQSQLTTARNNLSSLGSGTLLAANLAGQTIFPGVYTLPAGTTNLSGTVTLDGQGDANAFWVFQAPSTLITSPNSVVNVIGAGPGAGLFWNVGSSATIGTNSMFLGNILAQTAITMNTDATDNCGRALADDAAVTLDQNSLSGVCSGALAGSNGLSGSGLDYVAGPGGGGTIVDTGTGTVAVSEPPTLPLFALGLAALGFITLRRRHS